MEGTAGFGDRKETPLTGESLEIREGMAEVDPFQIVMLYRRAPLLRSLRTHDEIRAMFSNASLVLTAWYDGRFVGVARVLTDGVICSYLCDLAVEPDVQGRGVGKALIDAVLERCRSTELVLCSSEFSATYYEHIGFTKVQNAWSCPPTGRGRR